MSLYKRNKKHISTEKTSIRMFKAPKWKHFNYLPIEEWFKNMVVYLHNAILLGK